MNVMKMGSNECLWSVFFSIDPVGEMSYTTATLVTSIVPQKRLFLLELKTYGSDYSDTDRRFRTRAIYG